MADEKRTLAPSALWSVLLGVANLLLFAGERFLGGRALGWLGGALLAGTILARAVRVSKTAGEQRAMERMVLGLYGIVAVAVGMYFLASEHAMFLFGGRLLEHDWPRLATAIAALWPAAWLAGALPIVLVELAYASMALAPRLESARVRDAMLSGFGLAGALVFAFAVTYVASERDKKLDLSYFRTAGPGESTRKIVRSLDLPLQVALFFPPANEVRERVAEYFSALSKESKFLEVNSYDHAVDPAKAKELTVSGNGVVVVSRGGRHEQLPIGLELEQARGHLKDLDKEVQKRIVQVARPSRAVYLTTGHGERGQTPQSDTDKRGTARDFRKLLTDELGYTVHDLGAAEGLAADVPQDASFVAILGPQKPFAPEEIQSLDRYYARGGRILYALDPDLKDVHEWKELVAPLGLKYGAQVLANDQAFWARTHTPQDRINIGTASYSSHPAVTTLGHLGQRAPMVLLGAGSFEELAAKDKPKAALTADFPVRAHPATWNDANGNFQFDAPAETRKSWNLAAAVVRKNGAQPEGRALLLADSDAVMDGVVLNMGNAYFVLDGAKWLVGDEAIAGEVSSEADVPIAHTHKQDVVWFYSTIFFAPALALGVGWLVLRRRQRGGARREVKQS